MFRSSKRLAVIFLALVTAFFHDAAFAQNTIHVPGDQGTIQGAINAANNGDTVLVAPGNYVENINFNGKAITVSSSGGAGMTVIDGGGNDSVVILSTAEGPSSVLNGFTIQNGAPHGNGRGSGVYISSASPTITNNIVQNNTACGGSGIYSNAGGPKIQGNVIQNNVQPTVCLGGDGGGIFLGAANFAQVIGNIIVNNIEPVGSGGGIAMNGPHGVTISGNVIANNQEGSIAPDPEGGGIWIVNLVDAVITQNIIYGNTSGHSNTSGQGGGIFFIEPDTSPGLTLVNNTIVAGPGATQGSAIYTSYFADKSKIFNNLLIGYPGQDAVYCAGSSIPIFANNDVYSPSGIGFDGGCSGQTGQNGNISADPLFVNAAAGDFHLQVTSPAIDAGTNSAPNLLQTDFAGNPRILDGNNDCVSTVDLGAYELTRAANASFSTNTLTFPSQPLGTWSSPRSATLSNTGSTCFQFSGLGITGDFSQTSTCSAAGLRAGTSCSFNVTFRPAALGTRLGMLTVSGSDGITSASPSVNLRGVGADFSIAASPASSSVKHGQSVKFTVSVNPVGGSFGSPVALSCSGLPSGASCSFSPSSVLPGGNGATSVMTVSTVGNTQRGNYNVLIVGKSGSDSHSTTVLLSVN